MPRGRVAFKPTKLRSPGAFKIGLAFISKAWKTLRSIRRVSDQGHSQDAAVLVRVLYETVVRGLYILQRDCSHRTKLYLGFATLRRAQMIAAWTRTKGLKRSGARHLKQVESAVDDAAKVAGLSVEELKRQSAIFGNVEALGKELRFEGAYNTAYRSQSFTAHGYDVADHLHFGDDGTINLKLLPGGDKELTLALLTGELLFWTLVSRFSIRFGLKNKRQLSRVRPLLLVQREAKRQQAAASSI